MTKTQYIQYRIANDYYPILYYYYIEKSGVAISFNDFTVVLNHWLTIEQNKSIKLGYLISKESALETIIDFVISYFDKKHQVMYLIVNEEVKTKSAKTLIL